MTTDIIPCLPSAHAAKNLLIQCSLVEDMTIENVRSIHNTSDDISASTRDGNDEDSNSKQQLGEWYNEIM